jgi:hypothetical protein
MSDKVRLGFFSFTEVTDPAEHRSYNEWHQLDHMPEQYPLDGIVFGQRWVSTPRCRAARAVSESQLDPIHYVTLYLLAAPIERTLQEFMELGAELQGVGRFHEHRHAHLSGPLFIEDQAATERVLISAEAVPYRPNRGVYVVVDNAGGGVDTSRRGFASELLDLPGVAGCWTFATGPDVAPYRWTAGRHRVTVIWLDDEPLGVAPAIAAVEARTRSAATIFSGPFETITPWQWSWFDAQ